jgi:predicted Rossmann fold nucleotide-binding protein DprA/Smf involved in DNA uptake
MDRLESILTLMRLPGVGPARLRRALTELDQGQVPIEDAFGESGRRLLTHLGLGSSSPRSPVGAAVDGVLREGIRWFSAPFRDLALPAFVRKNLPPVIFLRGPAELLGSASVGFCGSRSASDRGLAVTADIADQVTDGQINVVSGGAKGVDTTAHATALGRGGTTTIVLAEGILQHRLRQELRDVFDPARTVAVSEFFPDDHWTVGRAMQRNRTICALSRALVLIEARSAGGTFAAGKAALDMGVPLFTADYRAQHEGNDGNRILLERGAVRLRQSRATGRANVAGLLELVRSDRVDVDAASESLGATVQQEIWTR